MNDSRPSSVTIEEAVARMVNLNYIPEGFTLEEMLAAFEEEAEVNYDNAKIDHVPEPQLALLKTRYEACTARCNLADSLLKGLLHAVKNPTESDIVVIDEGSSRVRLTLESVADWAAMRYGIEVPEWSTYSDASRESPPANTTWEDATVKLRANNRIAYSFGDGKFREKTFHDVGLIDRRKNEPNHLAGILIALSQHRKYPGTRASDNKHKKAISNLHRALEKLTGLRSDPFERFAPDVGWKPRFKLIDDRRNADDRAKRSAKHIPYDDGRMTYTYDREDDPAGNFLEEHDN